jgi:hypothetical protein
LISGDINQDGFINTSDYEEWYNYVLSGLPGGKGIATDLNADGFVNTTDYEIWYNNVLAGYTKVVPSMDKSQLENIKRITEKNHAVACQRIGLFKQYTCTHGDMLKDCLCSVKDGQVCMCILCGGANVDGMTQLYFDMFPSSIIQTLKEPIFF